MGATDTCRSIEPTGVFAEMPSFIGFPLPVVCGILPAIPASLPSAEETKRRQGPFPESLTPPIQWPPASPARQPTARCAIRQSCACVRARWSFTATLAPSHCSRPRRAGPSTERLPWRGGPGPCAQTLEIAPAYAAHREGIDGSLPPWLTSLQIFDYESLDARHTPVLIQND
jgi:hypothetical protein